MSSASTAGAFSRLIQVGMQRPMSQLVSGRAYFPRATRKFDLREGAQILPTRPRPARPSVDGKRPSAGLQRIIFQRTQSMDASLAALGGDFDSRSGADFRAGGSQLPLAAAGSRPATFLDVAGLRPSEPAEKSAGPVRPLPRALPPLQRPAAFAFFRGTCSALRPGRAAASAQTPRRRRPQTFL